MKKFFRIGALLLVLAMSFSVLAVAAETEETHDVAGETAYLDFAQGVDGEAEFIVVTPGANPDEKVSVTVRNDAFSAEDKYYLVLAITSTNGTDADTIKQDTILYIDQIEAKDNEVTFTVFPSVMKDSVILITGVKDDGTSNGQVKVAILKGKYVLGDLNGDKAVTTADLTRMAQYLAGTYSSSTQVADVTADGQVTTADLTRLARYLAGTAQLG